MLQKCIDQLLFLNLLKNQVLLLNFMNTCVARHSLHTGVLGLLSDAGCDQLGLDVFTSVV